MASLSCRSTCARGRTTCCAWNARWFSCSPAVLFFIVRFPLHDSPNRLHMNRQTPYHRVLNLTECRGVATPPTACSGGKQRGAPDGSRATGHCCFVDPAGWLLPQSTHLASADDALRSELVEIAEKLGLRVDGSHEAMKPRLRHVRHDVPASGPHVVGVAPVRHAGERQRLEVVASDDLFPDRALVRH